MVSAYPLSKTNQQHVTGLLKIQRSLAGGGTRVALVFEKALWALRTGPGRTHELPQGDCLIPTDNLLIIESERPRGKRSEKCGQPWITWNISILRVLTISPCCQNVIHRGMLASPSSSSSLVPSPQTPLPLNLIRFFSPLSHLLLWQSFNTVWLEFLSPVCTVCSKYLSTHWHSVRRDLGNLTHGNDFN